MSLVDGGGGGLELPVVTVAELKTTHLARDNFPGFAFCTDTAVNAYIESYPTQWRKRDGTVISNDPALATGVSITPNPARISPNGTRQFNAAVAPVDASQLVSWRSSNPDAVSISISGLAQDLGVLAEGETVQITATAASGVVGTVTLTISAAQLPATINTVWDGDSIVASQGATSAAKGYPPQVFAQFPEGATYYYTNRATSGIRASAINADYANRAGAAYRADAELNCLFLTAGTNDGAVTTFRATYRSLRGICRQARAQGYDRIVIGTLISRNDDPSKADGSWDAITLPLNLAIRQFWSNDLEADALSDFGIDPLFDVATDANDTAIYFDKLHPFDGGYARMAEINEAAILPVLYEPGNRTSMPAMWSPIDTSIYLAATNDGRTLAWAQDGFSNASSRAMVGAAAGKYAWETVADAAQYTQHGMCSRGYEDSIGTDFYDLGATTDAIGWVGTTLKYNGTNLVTMGALANGDVLQHCVDLDAKLYWVRKVGGLWNGSATANPTTGAGGIDISGLGTGVRYPAACISANGGRMTARFSASQMSAQVSGFVPFA